MTRLHLFLAVVMLTLSATLTETSWSRGFGGMHGGMGGMGGGMGGMGGGMGGMGGVWAVGGGMGGMRGGMGGMGVASATPGYGCDFAVAEHAAWRDVASGGFGNVANQRPNFGARARVDPHRGAALVTSPIRGRISALRDHLAVPAWASAAFPAGLRADSVPTEVGQRPRWRGRPAVDEFGAGGVGARPNRGQLGNFLGLPSDGGLHNVAGNQIRGDQRGWRDIRTRICDFEATMSAVISAVATSIAPIGIGDIRAPGTRGDGHTATFGRRQPGLRSAVGSATGTSRRCTITTVTT